MAAVELRRQRGRIRRAMQAARLAHTLHLQTAPELRGGTAWTELLEQELRWSDEFVKLKAQVEQTRPQDAKFADPMVAAVVGYAPIAPWNNGSASNAGRFATSCIKGNNHTFWTWGVGTHEECLWLAECFHDLPCQEARAHRERSEVQQLEERVLAAGGGVAVNVASERCASSNLAQANPLASTEAGGATTAPNAASFPNAPSSNLLHEALARPLPGSDGNRSGKAKTPTLQCLAGGPATTLDEVRELERAKTDRLREQMRAAELRLAAEAMVKHARTTQSHHALRLATLRNELLMETRLADDSAARRQAKAQAVIQTALEDQVDDADWLSQRVEDTRATLAAERLRLRVAFNSDDNNGYIAAASADLQRQFERTLRAIAEARERLQACHANAVGGVAPRPVETVRARIDREQMQALAEQYTQALEADASNYSTVTVRTPQGLAWARVEGEFP